MKKSILVLMSVFALASCSGSLDQANKNFGIQFDSGQYNDAAQSIALATIADKEPHDLYLGGLQCGTGYTWGNSAENAMQCFAAVDSVLSGDQDEDSSYQIKDYEKIMLKTYQAINGISMQDDFTKQILNRAYALQKMNIEDNGAEIERLRQEFAEDREKLQSAGLSYIPDMNDLVSQIESQSVDIENSVAPMKDFANPYTTWLIALYDGATGDINNATNRMKHVSEFAPNNKYVQSDVDGLSKGSVYVVFENGKVGPIKKRSLVPDALAPLAQPLTAIGVDAGIKLTIPDVYPGTKAMEYLHVSTDNETVETQFLASMDSIVKTDLDKYKTSNIMRAVVFEVGKIAAATVAGIAAHNASKGSPFQDMLTIAAVVGVMSFEQPWDLRSWDSVPNEIQTARVDMPENRQILVNDDFVVDIPTDAKNAIVFIRIPTPNAIPGVVVGTLN